MPCSLVRSGKQSVARLACVLAEAEFTQIELTNLELPSSRPLKEMMTAAGVEGTWVAFATDSQIIDERFQKMSQAC